MTSDAEKYLNSRLQTEITPLVRTIANIFKAKDLDLILEILNWLKANIKETDSVKEKTKLFRQRTATEIIKTKIATGCTDYALAFIALARAKGIPTKYIEAIRQRWLEKGDEQFIEGHVFAECFINGIMGSGILLIPTRELLGHLIGVL